MRAFTPIRCWRPTCANSRSGATGRHVLIAVARLAAHSPMIAYARLAVGACERLAPDADGFYALALMRLIKPPLTEKEIVAKEKEVRRLRDRLGLRKWCQRYAGEMAQARILVEALERQISSRQRSRAPAKLSRIQGLIAPPPLCRM
jgi:hypothetical protein